MSSPLNDPTKLERWRSRLAACIRLVNRCCAAVEGLRVQSALKRIPRPSAVRADHDGLKGRMAPSTPTCGGNHFGIRIAKPSFTALTLVAIGWGLVDADCDGGRGLRRPGFGGLSGRFR